jgi:hypothetical protein
MERDELDQIERVINHELRERFLTGAVERAVLLQHGDDPAIEPGQLLVRVFVPARPGSSGRCPMCLAPVTSTGRSTC